MRDLIDRQAAIDALARMMPRSYTPDGSHPADEEIFRAQEVFADCIKALEILPSAQPDNQINLCDSCDYSYPECPSEKDDIIFGNGIGNDNICACNKYKPSVQPEKRTEKRTETHARDLIDREAAIDALDRIGSLDTEADKKYARSIFEALPSAQPEPRWTPCSERLPKKERRTYWVCTDAGTQCECRWTNINHIWTGLTTNWHWHICDYPKYTKVVAWMELPEPYEGGDSE